MIKKTVVTLSISSSLFVVPYIVTAVEQETITSQGSVSLITDPDPGPVDPLFPTDPPGDTGNAGLLTIDNVAHIQFGEQKLSGNQEVHTSLIEDSNIQITDRRGSAAAWKVIVSATEFKDYTTKEVLKGVEIFLPRSRVQASEPTNVSDVPISHSIRVNAEPSIIMQSSPNGSLGTWVKIFDKDEIKLTIPTGNPVGEFHSTLTWSLLDVPL